MASRRVLAGLWLVSIAIVIGAFLHPPKAHSEACDARWQSCAAPRWCPSTGTLIGPYSGYCPVGPNNYSPPWGDDDDA